MNEFNVAPQTQNWSNKNLQDTVFLNHQSVSYSYSERDFYFLLNSKNLRSPPVSLIFNYLIYLETQKEWARNHISSSFLDFVLMQNGKVHTNVFLRVPIRQNLELLVSWMLLSVSRKKVNRNHRKFQILWMTVVCQVKKNTSISSEV